MTLTTAPSVPAASATAAHAWQAVSAFAPPAGRLSEAKVDDPATVHQLRQLLAFLVSRGGLSAQQAANILALLTSGTAMTLPPTAPITEHGLYEALAAIIAVLPPDQPESFLRRPVVRRRARPRGGCHRFRRGRRGGCRARHRGVGRAPSPLMRRPDSAQRPAAGE